MKKTRTLEDLETDTDDNMVDITNFFDRPQNEKRSPRPTPIKNNSEQCPTQQKSPTHMPKSSVPAPPISPKNPIEMRLGGSYQIKEEYPVVGQLVLEDSHPG